MIETIVGYAQDPIWFVGGYAAPTMLCAFGYIRRSYNDIQRDKRDLAKSLDQETKGGSSYYQPTITVGTLIGRAIVTMIPAVNFLVAVFDHGPELFGSFFRTIGKMFDRPLIADPRKK
jgi:hypothetical protein